MRMQVTPSRLLTKSRKDRPTEKNLIRISLTAKVVLHHPSFPSSLHVSIAPSLLDLHSLVLAKFRNEEDAFTRLLHKY